MNRDIGERWVRALRSGDYKQGQGRLTRLNADGTPASHCCLGVLCEIALKDGIVTAEEDNNGVSFARRYRGVDDNTVGYNYLPEAVMKWAGLKDSNPRVSVPAVGGMQQMRTTMAALNDERNYNFDQIATVIEEQLIPQEAAA